MKKQLAYAYSSLIREWREGGSLAFDPEELDKIEGFKERQVWVERQPDQVAVGRGSSRYVYLIDNDKVLKLAMNEAGLAQNEAEVNTITHPRTTKLLLADIYDYSTKDYRWILAEYAKRISYDQFENLTGFPFRLILIFGLVDGDFDKFRDRLELFNIHHLLRDETVIKFFTELAATVKATGLSLGDLAGAEQWGKAQDGRVVLVDYGASDEVLDKFYGQPK